MLKSSVKIGAFWHSLRIDQQDGESDFVLVGHVTVAIVSPFSSTQQGEERSWNQKQRRKHLLLLFAKDRWCSNWSGHRCCTINRIKCNTRQHGNKFKVGCAAQNTVRTCPQHHSLESASLALAGTAAQSYVLVGLSAAQCGCKQCEDSDSMDNTITQVIPH